ncbi:MAG TPA: histidine kinase [Thermoanaerobaculia bacterium]|nr:histidine kinase [Thermoanaerobaculia bacterium]
MKITARRFGELFGFSLTILTIWIVFGIFTSSEFYRRSAETEAPPAALAPVLFFQFTTSFLWAVFTPVAIGIAERLPLRPPHRLRNALLILAISPLFSLVRAALGGAVHDYVLEGRVTTAFVMLSINLRFHRNVFLFLVIVGITNLILLQRASAEREQSALQLRTAVMNAELQRLRASMQPRLMFATLDAIAAKVATRPDVADQILVQLGDLLRTMIDFGKRPSVSLEEELEVIDRYFEIEKTRTDGSFTTRIDIEEELLPARIPPLVLQALVESALHVEGDRRRHLEIRGGAERGILAIEILNTDPHTASMLTLEETRTRLRQAFGDEATVATRSEDGRVVTRLTMPLQFEGETV